MEAVSLWFCWVVVEAQAALIAAFRSVLLGLVSLILLLATPHRFSLGFRSGQLAGQSSAVIPWSWNLLLVVLLLWVGVEMAVLTLDSGLTAAENTAPKIITDRGNFTPDLKQLGFLCLSLPPDSGTFPNEMQKYFYLKKRNLDQWLNPASLLSLSSAHKFLNQLCLAIHPWSSLLLVTLFQSTFYEWFLIQHFVNKTVSAVNLYGI